MKTIQVSDRYNRVKEITFNRPKVHNAFNLKMIDEICETLLAIIKERKTRLIIFKGSGKSFSAGADLNEMKNGDKGFSLSLSKLFETLGNCPIPIISLVQGAALGGGMGIVACSHIVFSDTSSRFGFSEVRLGLAPAVISPYILKKVSVSNLYRYFLSGEKISPREARRVGLIHEVFEVEKFEEQAYEYIQKFLKNSSTAQFACLELLEELLSKKETKDYTIDLITKLRNSEDGQEGIWAVLEKRKPQFPSENIK